ncbi:hypothetical protein VP01_545g2 [Puccinia sorghi]|uniref:Uncharacterized protein n=1 Tax=Puccinia sorghi TaxID=27349 RepID=A0A0L6UJM2_9BASI|nr:hypothetical protein VP01_545g2 [Puccinia sorghi]
MDVTKIEGSVEMDAMTVNTILGCVETAKVCQNGSGLRLTIPNVIMIFHAKLCQDNLFETIDVVTDDYHVVNVHMDKALPTGDSTPGGSLRPGGGQRYTDSLRLPFRNAFLESIWWMAYHRDKPTIRAALRLLDCPDLEVFHCLKLGVDSLMRSISDAERAQARFARRLVCKMLLSSMFEQISLGAMLEVRSMSYPGLGFGGGGTEEGRCSSTSSGMGIRELTSNSELSGLSSSSADRQSSTSQDDERESRFSMIDEDVSGQYFEILTPLLIYLEEASDYTAHSRISYYLLIEPKPFIVSCFHFRDTILQFTYLKIHFPTLCAMKKLVKLLLLVMFLLNLLHFIMNLFINFSIHRRLRIISNPPSCLSVVFALVLFLVLPGMISILITFYLMYSSLDKLYLSFAEMLNCFLALPAPISSPALNKGLHKNFTSTEKPTKTHRPIQISWILIIFKWVCLLFRNIINPITKFKNGQNGYQLCQWGCSSGIPRYQCFGFHPNLNFKIQIKEKGLQEVFHFVKLMPEKILDVVVLMLTRSMLFFQTAINSIFYIYPFLSKISLSLLRLVTIPLILIHSADSGDNSVLPIQEEENSTNNRKKFRMGCAIGLWSFLKSVHVFILFLVSLLFVLHHDFPSLRLNNMWPLFLNFQPFLVFTGTFCAMSGRQDCLIFMKYCQALLNLKREGNHNGFFLMRQAVNISKVVSVYTYLEKESYMFLTSYKNWNSFKRSLKTCKATIRLCQQLHLKCGSDEIIILLCHSSNDTYIVQYLKSTLEDCYIKLQGSILSLNIFWAPGGPQRPLVEGVQKYRSFMSRWTPLRINVIFSHEHHPSVGGGDYGQRRKKWFSSSFSWLYTFLITTLPEYACGMFLHLEYLFPFPPLLEVMGVLNLYYLLNNSIFKLLSSEIIFEIINTIIKDVNMVLFILSQIEMIFALILGQVKNFNSLGNIRYGDITSVVETKFGLHI